MYAGLFKVYILQGKITQQPGAWHDGALSSHERRRNRPIERAPPLQNS